MAGAGVGGCPSHCLRPKWGAPWCTDSLPRVGRSDCSFYDGHWCSGCPCNRVMKCTCLFLSLRKILQVGSQGLGALRALINKGPVISMSTVSGV